VICLILFVCVVIFYYLGGQKWADSKIRDIGCPACAFAIMALLFKWDWIFIPSALAMFGGLTIGDHEEWFWLPHSFVISMAFLPFAIIHGAWGQFTLMVFIVNGGTYLASRFLNKYGVDVILRGALYASIPFYFLISKLHN
jgi:hypothetical protein